MPPQALPVITVASMPATTYQEFTASLQGRKDIEIRPQVDGYIDKIYVDEGAHVKKGQPLFHINDRLHWKNSSQNREPCRYDYCRAIDCAFGNKRCLCLFLIK